MTEEATTQPEGEGAGADAGAPSGPSPDDEEMGLEKRLERLDRIVSALEADDVELEKALELFEEGVAHVRAAEKILSEAELRVEELVGDEDDLDTRPLEGEAG